MILRLAAGVAAAILVAAGVLSVRLAWSDALESRNDLTSIQKAIGITPLNAHAMVTAALQMEAADPQTKKDEAVLRTALDLNPRNATAWMALGMKAESAGEADVAEKDFLEAARVDHTFKPAWTLANFYARAGQMDRFWQWMHTCLEMIEPKNQEGVTFDPQPLFDLCWNMTDDAKTILNRAVPHQRFVLVRYVAFLIGTNRLDALADAAVLAPSAATQQELEILLAACDRLIAAHRANDAVRVWNALSRQKLIAPAALDPANGASLSNGDLKSASLRQGFDWLFPNTPGVYESYVSSGPYLRFDLNGEEPEYCEIVAQTVPVVGGARYKFGFKYQTTDIPARTGFQWLAVDAAAGKETGAPANFPGREEPGDESFEFAVPPSADLVRLVLRYVRQPGTIRPKGTLKLLRMNLQLIP